MPIGAHIARDQDAEFETGHVGRVLGAMEDANNGFAYAMAPGSTAADGSGCNGVYTSHLLQNMRTPTLPIEQVFKNVRIGVMKETNGKQTPWESSSPTGNFTFMPST